MRRVALLLLLSALAALTAAAPAAAGQPWRAAEQARQDLFSAQTALDLDEPADARAEVARAQRRLRAGLGDAGGPAARRTLRTGLDDARAAVRDGDAVALAAARGEVQAGAFAIAVDEALAALARDDATAARRWLLLRDFRTATRFTRPGVDATLAVRALAEGRTSPRRARLITQKDLLDAYQSKQRELLGDAERARRRGFRPAQAEAAGQAAAVFEILAPRYTEERGDENTERARARFAALRDAAVAGDDAAFARARAGIDRALDGFTAAPFTEQEQARRANQLERFVSLVPIEYRDGTEDGRVTVEFELQEAVAFLDGASSAYADLADAMRRQDARAAAAAKAGIATLERAVADATEGTKVIGEDEVKDVADQTLKDLQHAFPQAWKETSDESDFDLIAMTLDRLEAAVAAGQYRQAEQARLEMYAFFEFGPELRLRPFDPALAADVEGLVWFGARDTPGLAALVAQHAPIAQVRETRAVLDEALDESKATLGDGASQATIITNAAIIVFREGLEAVLILAAITASLIGANRRRRRPIFIGAAFGLVASAITWVLAQFVLTSLSQYGEKLEAVVGVIAIAVLLLVMNWFFHRVYWSQWIGGFHQRRRELLAEEKAGERVGFWSASVLGFGMLGLTSVYREGFETVLFLQSLQLSAGTGVVLAGVALGLAAVGAVAVVTFTLEHKLPYKKMLVVTGVLLGVVLVMLVGQTVRTMQGTGWLPITPIALDIPYWMGMWFGVFPTWETIGAQVAAFAFVVGSYYAAEYVRIKKPQRRAAAVRASAAAEERPAPADEPEREREHV